MKAYVVLEDGKVFEGKSFGAAGEAFGQIAFDTNMFDYQEILTDAASTDKAIVMTYTEIGNCGISAETNSKKISASGIIVKAACKYPSNYTSTGTLGDYLKRNGKIGIENIDTRAIVRHVRNNPKKAVLFAGDETPDFAKLAEKAKDWKAA